MYPFHPGWGVTTTLLFTVPVSTQVVSLTPDDETVFSQNPCPFPFGGPLSHDTYCRTPYNPLPPGTPTFGSHSSFPDSSQFSRTTVDPPVPRHKRPGHMVSTGDVPTPPTRLLFETGRPVSRLSVTSTPVPGTVRPSRTGSNGPATPTAAATGRPRPTGPGVLPDTHCEVGVCTRASDTSPASCVATTSPGPSRRVS